MASALTVASCRSEPPFTLRRLAVDTAGGGDGAIAPDGLHFAISSKRTGRWKLWLYDIAQRRWSRLTESDGDDFEPQWSPDGTSIAFTSTASGNKDVYVLKVATRAVRRLTTSADDDEYPSWSPDGGRLVYTGGPWQARHFYIVDVNGGLPRVVTRGAGRAGACSFEPSGRTLVCHSYDVGSGQLLRISVATGVSQPITDGRSWDYKPVTSPNGRWTAFSRAQEGPTSIWVLDAAGGRPQRLTTSGADDSWPSWNARSDALFFHRILDHGNSVRLLDRKTLEVRVLVGEEEKPMQAALDSSGRFLVYCAGERGTQQLRVLDIEHKRIRKVVTLGEACFARWSPDGTRIAYVERAPASDRWEVATIQRDGSHHHVWTASVAWLRGLYGPLDWSPDGTRIVFRTDTQPFESAIVVLDTRSGELHPVTNDSWWNEAPSWSPDGQGIILMSTRGGNWTWGLFELRIANNATRVLAGPDYVEKNFPRMAPDGTTIWSAYSTDGIEKLVERLPTGQERTLEAAGPGARWPSYSSDGRWIVYTQIDHRVEYWIAEHLFSAGSPLQPMSLSLTNRISSGVRRLIQTPPARAETDACGSTDPSALHVTTKQSQNRTLVRGSPVDLHRR